MDALALGRLAAPWGLKGELKLISFSGETDHILKLKKVELRNAQSHREVEIENARPYMDSVLLKIKGFDSPEEAASLTGWELWAKRSQAAPLLNDEHYIADLVDCQLLVSGKALGTLVSVCDGGNGELLEFRLETGRDVLIPFRKEFIGRVNTLKKEIELLAPWILEE